MSEAKAKILRNKVKRAMIKRRRFVLLTRPIAVVCGVIIPLFIIATTVDSFIPFMPDIISYTGIIITSIAFILGCLDVVITNKLSSELRDAVMNYRRYISKA